MKKWIAIIAGAVAVLCGGLLWAKAASGPENAVEKFEQAVKQNDIQLLQKYLTVKKTASVSKDQAVRVLSWLKRNTTVLDENLMNLEAQVKQLKSNEQAASQTTSAFTIYKAGSSWIFFDSYQIDMKPTFAYTRALKEITLTTTEPGVTITEDVKESTIDQKAYKIGPLFPGEYTLVAKMSTMLGPIEKKITFSGQLGKDSTFPVHLDTKQLQIFTNHQNARLFYKGKQLPVKFSKDLLDYSTTLNNVPAEPLDFTLKAQTPFGELEAHGKAAEKDKTLDLPVEIGKAPHVRKALQTLFAAYNKAWVEYAQKKTTIAPLEKYLVANSKAKQSYETELAAFLKSPPLFQDVFAGKFQTVAIDFGSLRIENDKTVTIRAKEIFLDQWKNIGTGKIQNNGKEELYWTYKLQLVNGEWKIADYWEVPAWSWSDKISDIVEVKL